MLLATAPTHMRAWLGYLSPPLRTVSRSAGGLAARPHDSCSVRCLVGRGWQWHCGSEEEWEIELGWEAGGGADRRVERETREVVCAHMEPPGFMNLSRATSTESSMDSRSRK